MLQIQIAMVSTDGQEVALTTDPLDPDTDNDGLCDGGVAGGGNLFLCFYGGEDISGDGFIDPQTRNQSAYSLIPTATVLTII